MNGLAIDGLLLFQKKRRTFKKRKRNKFKKGSFRKAKESLIYKKVLETFSDAELLILKKRKKIMTDFTKIISQAKELELKMKESQEKIKNIIVEGISGSNSVKVTLNGDGEMIKIDISPETMKEEQSIIEDLIVAAHNNAKTQLKTKTSEEISKTTDGFGIPGFKWPL